MLYQLILFLVSNSVMVISAETEYFVVERTKTDQMKFGQSLDRFTNKDFDKSEGFCQRRNATCSTKECEVCQCRSGEIWISCRYGCKHRTYLGDIGVDEGKCFTVQSTGNWIPTISKNISRTTQYRLYTNAARILPSNIDTINTDCRTKDLQSIYNGTTTKLAGEFADGINIATKLAYKTIQFKDIANLTGRLLMVNIECTDKTQSTTFDACFLFKVEGTFRLGVIPPIRPPGDQGNSNNGDNNMGIVKPLVIVGCILLVFICVGIYCLYKRNQFQKEQQERKLYSATYSNEKKTSVATMTGYVGAAAQLAVTTTVNTINVELPEPEEDTQYADPFDSPKLGVPNGGYEYVDAPPFKENSNNNKPKTPRPESLTIAKPTTDDSTDKIQHSNNITNNNVNTNDKKDSVSTRNDYCELEKDDSHPSSPGEYQQIDPGNAPVKYQEINAPLEANKNNDNAEDEHLESDYEGDKETTNPYYQLADTNNRGSESPLYEEVMREYDRISSLPRQEKVQALGQG